MTATDWNSQNRQKGESVSSIYQAEKTIDAEKCKQSLEGTSNVLIQKRKDIGN